MHAVNQRSVSCKGQSTVRHAESQHLSQSSPVPAAGYSPPAATGAQVAAGNNSWSHASSGAAGIMPIMTYGGFKRMTGFCKTYVPPEITKKLEEIKDNDEAVKQYGIDLASQTCKRLLEAGLPGLHMYTLNLERTAVTILENLGILGKDKVPLAMSINGIAWCRA